jgi:hypothetical protein
VKKIQSFNRYIQLLNSKNHNSSATYRRKEFSFQIESIQNYVDFTIPSCVCMHVCVCARLTPHTKFRCL